MIVDGKKRCAKCGQTKVAAEHFYSAVKRLDGFDPYCKSCHVQKSKSSLAKAKANPPVIDPNAKKSCAACKQVKLHSEFTKDKRSPTGIGSYCLECHTERTRGPALANWRANRDERKAALNAKRKTAEYKAERSAYRKRPEVRAVELDRNRLRKAMIRQTEYAADGHKTRELSIEGGFTRADWVALLKEFENACAYCGAQTTMTMEHLTPLSRGGKNEVGNIVPAYLPCNASKKDKMLEEFEPVRAPDIRERARLN